MSRKSIFILIIFLLGFFLANFSAEAQCAMCKAAAESDLKNDPNSVARGLNKGILFLMAFPYLIVGVIFRKELLQLLRNLRSKSKEPLSPARKQWLIMALTFSGIIMILFIVFLKVNSR